MKPTCNWNKISILKLRPNGTLVCKLLIDGGPNLINDAQTCGNVAAQDAASFPSLFIHSAVESI